MSKNIIALLLVCCAGCFTAWGQESGSPKARLAIVSQYEVLARTAQEFEFLVGVNFKLKPGWHIYWRNPGDSGAPPEFTWNSLPDASFSPAFWPVPQKIQVAHLTNLGYEEEVTFPFKVNYSPKEVGNPTLPLDLKVEYLICKEDCIPQSMELHKDIRFGEAPIASEWDLVLRDLLSRIPGERTYKVSGFINGSSMLLELPIPNYTPETFLPYQENLISLTGPQSLTDSGWQLPAPTTPLKEMDGILIYPDSRGVEVKVIMETPSPAATAPENSPVALWLLIANAFLGGVILNAMPCVFPVIGIKILQFAQSAAGCRKSLFLHGLLFAVGILVSMWILAGTMLALKAAGNSIGWGFQLQSPLFVGALIVLFSILSAHLLDLVSFGDAIQTKAGNLDTGSGKLGALLSGVLATVIATPCTAPFMGYALGFAATLPVLENMLIFTSLGLGMAAPYVLLCLFPQTVTVLPKPGAWMLTLKKVLAFPLMLTVVWLLSVLLQQLEIEAPWIIWTAVAVIILGLGIFLYKDFKPRSPLAAYSTAGSCLLLAITTASMGLLTHKAAQDSEQLWKPFNSREIASLIAAREPVFVDFTAAWCITCQVNKKNVLETERVEEAFKKHGVHLFRADWTSQDEEITRALQELQRQGVPVNVLYSPDAYIFPALLSQSMVIEALDKSIEKSP
jgi:thiol:disulfide interchange protein